jgi:hypothetical protein
MGEVRLLIVVIGASDKRGGRGTNVDRGETGLIDSKCVGRVEVTVNTECPVGRACVGRNPVSGTGFGTNDISPLRECSSLFSCSTKSTSSLFDGDILVVCSIREVTMPCRYRFSEKWRDVCAGPPKSSRVTRVLEWSIVFSKELSMRDCGAISAEGGCSTGRRMMDKRTEQQFNFRDASSHVAVT